MCGTVRNIAENSCSDVICCHAVYCFASVIADTLDICVSRCWSICSQAPPLDLDRKVHSFVMTFNSYLAVKKEQFNMQQVDEEWQ